jgi:hypothetical protein
VIQKHDRPLVALVLTASMILGSPRAPAPARAHPAATCEILPPNCSTSAPHGSVWTGTSHCDVESDGRVWTTCEYLMPGKL